MPLQANGPAPYTSASAVVTLLNRFRNGLPPKVTPEFLIKNGIKESIVPRTLQSLRYLELTDEDGTPTESLEALSKARPDEYRAELANFLRSVYSEVFKYIEPATADGEAIRNAFWGYEPRGQIEAMIRLFLGLCQEAGLIPDEKRAPAKPREKPRRDPLPRREKSAREKPIVSGASGAVDAQLGGLPAGLVGLLRQIPPVGATWTSERRDAFLAAFRAVLDFTIPVDDSPPPQPLPDSEAVDADD